MRIVFAGGGTVGHISPSLAVAEELLKTDHYADILFIGRENGDENEIIKRAGYKLKTVQVVGLERKLTLRNLKNAYLALRAVYQAKALLKSYKPNVVFGTGGYVSYPILKAAQKLGIKTVIHESNATLGLASKSLLSNCDLLLTGIKDTEITGHKCKRIVNSGNPVRNEFLTADRNDSRKKLGIGRNEILITSFGGSGGSKKLNEVIIDLMCKFSLKNSNVTHIHASGKKYFNEIEKDFPLLTKGRNGCIIKPYFHDVSTLLSASDITITRCGAMTIAELSACSTPSILIPSPNVTGDHQTKNAKHLYDHGAAIMLSEDELKTETLINEVKILIEDKRKRKNLSKRINEFTVKDSRQKIVKEIKKLL